MQVSRTILAVFLSTSDVDSSLSSDGFSGSEHDRRKHLWILRHVGCHGSRRLHHIKRSKTMLRKFSCVRSLDSLSQLLTSFLPWRQIGSRDGGFGDFGYPRWRMLKTRLPLMNFSGTLGIRYVDSHCLWVFWSLIELFFCFFLDGRDPGYQIIPLAKRC